ncbi:MAG TPA: hypothetical protein VKP30_02935, partial [Polyangiaceae bacterium]|nr:hypothetical protein [Polyangiaceae bacterium]
EPRQNQSVEPRTVVSAEQRQRAAITDLSLVSSTRQTNAAPPAGAPSAQEARNARPHAVAKRLFIGAAVSGALFFGSLTSAYLAHRRHVVRAPVVQDVIAVATATPMISATSPRLRSAPAPSVGVTAPEETNILTAVALAKEPAVSVSAQPTITTKPSAEQTLAIPKPSAVTPPRQAASKAKRLSPSDLRIKALEEELARRQRAKSTSPMRSAFQPQ